MPRPRHPHGQLDRLDGTGGGGSAGPYAFASLRNDWNPALGVAGSGSAVSTWTDQVSGGVMEQTTAAWQPAWAASDADFGGRPSISFDGSDDWMESTAAASTWAFLHSGAGATIFAVIKTSGTSDQYWLGNTQLGVFKRGVIMNDARYAPTVTRSPQASLGDGTTINTMTASSAVSDNGSHWHALVTEPGGSGVQGSLYCSDNATAATTSVAGSSSDPQTALRIGRPGASALRWTGKLARLCVFNAALSAADIAALKTWAISYYGVRP